MIENLRYRADCVRRETPDGYGEVQSLRNVCVMAYGRLRELESVEPSYRKYLKKVEDDIVRSLLSELDSLREALKKAEEAIQAALQVDDDDI